MTEQVKKHQQTLILGLIVLCVGIIMAGGIRYVGLLRQDLHDAAVRNLTTVAVQQQQAVDSFIGGDQAEVHHLADYFARHAYHDAQELRGQMDMINAGDSIYLVICLDEGWVCGTSFDEARQLDSADLAAYRSLSGTGVRDLYTGLYSGTQRFSYYETFTFASGHKGLIQKSYDRSQVSRTISLSVYNGLGWSHVVNRDGEILLRPEGPEDFRESDIFHALELSGRDPADVEAFRAQLLAGNTGSMTLAGAEGDYICAYLPIESVDGWYLVSVVPARYVEAESGAIVSNLQTALLGLFALLGVCAVLVVTLWRRRVSILEKDQVIAYQEDLFDIFIDYLSNNTDDMYMMLDQETEKLEYVSPNVERVLGVSRREALPFLAASDLEADAEEARAYYKELSALRPGQAAKPRSVERVNPKTGERKYFLESAYCVDIQGRKKRVAYLSDRTREKRTQDSMAEALRMAQAANEAKSAFLSNMSHDIRTPMNAIIGFTALMRDEADNPPMVLEYTQRIDAAGQHLLSLINDVLDMNRIESGSTTLNIGELNLAEVIDELNTLIRPQTKEKGQAFELSVSHLAHEHLLGDKLRLNQILINLLSNAVKYTPAGGAIQMRVEELPQVVSNYSRVRFTVSDNGLGMSEDYLKVIFDPFTREESKATYGIQGTGLGMAITKSLVDLMGGTITVESRLGEGSAFTVELELRIQDQADPENELKFWDRHSVTRMLVTDDDEEACRNIVLTMAETGVETDYATDGETAIRMMRENREAGRPYDLILLDWNMPGLNGLETARLIRKNYSQKIPILLLTAYDWGDIEQEAMEIGVTHFMPKPFFMSTFKEAIRRVMGTDRKADADQSDVVLGRHILVVDDIEVNRIILVKILGTLGADCDTAGNGQEAVDKFLGSQPGEYDLILMDVQMPVLDGYGATRAIRSSGHPLAKDIPIIAMTANAFVDDVRDAIDAGMDAHIAKPVQVDKLKDTIRQVLDGREAKTGR